MAISPTLKRFISRRGICKALYSDNELCRGNYEWKFILPHSLHQGDFWAAAVELTKYIKRILKQGHLSFEYLSTVFCQIEVVINSRPLLLYLLILLTAQHWRQAISLLAPRFWPFLMRTWLKYSKSFEALRAFAADGTKFLTNLVPWMFIVPSTTKQMADIQWLPSKR